MAGITVEQYHDLCERLKAYGETRNWRDAFGKWHTEYIAERDNKRISFRSNGLSKWLCFFIDGSAVNVFSEVTEGIVATGKPGSYKQFCEILKNYENKTDEETKDWLDMLT